MRGFAYCFALSYKGCFPPSSSHHAEGALIILIYLLFFFFLFMRREWVPFFKPYDGRSLSSGHNALCPSSKAYMPMLLRVLPFLGLVFALLLGCLDSIPFLSVGSLTLSAWGLLLSSSGFPVLTAFFVILLRSTS